jgi:NAD(P)-dependent dehydrogenase (short-subunit alcohol dehydrogenase family)
MDISNVAAIVTGGASGLGGATAGALVDRGARVVIVDRDAESGAAAAERLGDPCTFVRADVTNVDDISEAVKVAAGTDRPLRVAVNCAGIAIGQRTVSRDGEPADLDAFARVVNVNLIGTYNVAAQAAAAMASGDPLAHGERGVIINTASIAAFEGQIGQTAYAASKGGVVGLTLPMARDLASVGVRVNTIAPGIIDTPLLGSLDEDMREALASGVPFPKRLGLPADYATLAISIIENGYINGETIRIDGALRMPPR